jgi:citrate lyase subunit beta/citryl-CoA lyase
MRAIEKSRRLPADVIIFDLEDAVAPDAKSEARAAVAKNVREGGFGRRELVIRINPLSTEWGRLDLEAALAAEPDGVLVPKVSRPEDLEPIQSALARHGSKTSIWAMMETPRAMLGGLAIAEARATGIPSLAAFVVGTNDLAKEMRTSGRNALTPLLLSCVAAARCGGIDILDGVFNSISDTAGFATECRAGRDLGMDGKTVIHPSQIETANRTFSPSAEEIARSRRIVEAFELPENRNAGVLKIDGEMVERLHLDTARRVLAVASAIEAVETGAF